MFSTRSCRESSLREPGRPRAWDLRPHQLLKGAARGPGGARSDRLKRAMISEGNLEGNSPQFHPNPDDRGRHRRWKEVPGTQGRSAPEPLRISQEPGSPPCGHSAIRPEAPGCLVTLPPRHNQSLWRE